MWSQRAEAGDPVAQFHVGYCYEMGQGMPVDHEAAFGWFLRAARQGYPRAQYHVGLAYACGGQGVEWNLTEACQWLTLAARNGIKEAEQQLRRNAFPTEHRVAGEQAAKNFKPQPEFQKPIEPVVESEPSPDTIPGAQLGLGL